MSSPSHHLQLVSLLYHPSSGSARRNKSTASCVERRLLERRRVDWEKVIVIPPPKEDPVAPLGSERTPSPSLVTVIEPFFKERAEPERKCQLRLVTLFLDDLLSRLRFQCHLIATALLFVDDYSICFHEDITIFKNSTMSLSKVSKNFLFRSCL